MLNNWLLQSWILQISWVPFTHVASSPCTKCVETSGLHISAAHLLRSPKKITQIFDVLPTFWCPILGVFQVGFRWYGAIYLQLKSLSSMISKNLFLSYFFSPTWRSFTTAFLLLLPSWGFCLEDVEKNDLQPNNPNTKPSKSKWMS